YADYRGQQHPDTGPTTRTQEIQGHNYRRAPPNQPYSTQHAYAHIDDRDRGGRGRVDVREPRVPNGPAPDRYAYHDQAGHGGNHAPPAAPARPPTPQMDYIEEYGPHLDIPAFETPADRAEREAKDRQMQKQFGAPIPLLEPLPSQDVGLHAVFPKEFRGNGTRNMHIVMCCPEGNVRKEKAEVATILKYKYRYVFRRSWKNMSESIRRRLMLTVMTEFGPYTQWAKSVWRVKKVLTSMGEDGQRNYNNKRRTEEKARQQARIEFERQLQTTSRNRAISGSAEHERDHEPAIEDRHEQHRQHVVDDQAHVYYGHAHGGGQQMNYGSRIEPHRERQGTGRGREGTGLGHAPYIDPGHMGPEAGLELGGSRDRSDTNNRHTGAYVNFQTHGPGQHARSGHGHGFARVEPRDVDTRRDEVYTYHGRGDTRITAPDAYRHPDIDSNSGSPVAPAAAMTDGNLGHDHDSAFERDVNAHKAAFERARLQMMSATSHSSVPDRSGPDEVAQGSSAGGRFQNNGHGYGPHVSSSHISERYRDPESINVTEANGHGPNSNQAPIPRRYANSGSYSHREDQQYQGPNNSRPLRSRSMSMSSSSSSRNTRGLEQGPDPALVAVNDKRTSHLHLPSQPSPSTLRAGSLRSDTTVDPFFAYAQSQRQPVHPEQRYDAYGAFGTSGSPQPRRRWLSRHSATSSMPEIEPPRPPFDERTVAAASEGDHDHDDDHEYHARELNGGHMLARNRQAAASRRADTSSSMLTDEMQDMDHQQQLIGYDHDHDVPDPGMSTGRPSERARGEPTRRMETQPKLAPRSHSREREYFENVYDEDYIMQPVAGASSPALGDPEQHLNFDRENTANTKADRNTPLCHGQGRRSELDRVSETPPPMYEQGDHDDREDIDYGRDLTPPVQANLYEAGRGSVGYSAQGGNYNQHIPMRSSPPVVRAVHDHETRSLAIQSAPAHSPLEQQQLQPGILQHIHPTRLPSITLTPEREVNGRGSMPRSQSASTDRSHDNYSNRGIPPTRHSPDNNAYTYANAAGTRDRARVGGSPVSDGSARGSAKWSSGNGKGRSRTASMAGLDMHPAVDNPTRRVAYGAPVVSSTSSIQVPATQHHPLHPDDPANRSQDFDSGIGNTHDAYGGLDSSLRARLFTPPPIKYPDHPLGRSLANYRDRKIARVKGNYNPVGPGPIRRRLMTTPPRDTADGQRARDIKRMFSGESRRVLDEPTQSVGNSRRARQLQRRDAITGGAAGGHGAVAQARAHTPTSSTRPWRKPTRFDKKAQELGLSIPSDIRSLPTSELNNWQPTNPVTRHGREVRIPLSAYQMHRDNEAERRRSERKSYVSQHVSTQNAQLFDASNELSSRLTKDTDTAAMAGASNPGPHNRGCNGYWDGRSMAGGMHMER
ncbi:hypothetical protein BJ508DRAFT_335225, partial [Ascobolus immersus RN42]